MSRICTVCTALATSLMLALAAAPGASADAFHDIYNDYARTGKIDPCRYTSKQLKDARKQVPGDISQYAPDFPDALDAAAQQRAAGNCNKKSSSSTTGSTTGTTGVGAATTGSTTGTTTGAVTTTGVPGSTTTIPAPTQTPTPTPTATPSAQTTLPDAALASSTDQPGNNDTPIPLLLLAILGGLALVGGATVGAVRYWAFDAPWMARMRHSVAEAGWRASAAWAEFTDWVRFGR